MWHIDSREVNGSQPHTDNIDAPPRMYAAPPFSCAAARAGLTPTFAHTCVHSLAAFARRRPALDRRRRCRPAALAARAAARRDDVRVAAPPAPTRVRVALARAVPPMHRWSLALCLTSGGAPSGDMDEDDDAHFSLHARRLQPLRPPSRRRTCIAPPNRLARVSAAAHHNHLRHPPSWEPRARRHPPSPPPFSSHADSGHTLEGRSLVLCWLRACPVWPAL